MKRTSWPGPSVLLAIVVMLCGKTVHAGPMSTAGQFEVSPTGAATYTIPIQVPPGTAGIEPKLSLVYNSQSGNSLLGVGWSLSGLSAITRCPRTMAQDGVRGAVNYDMNDRFCLDGQRLMAISGTYGADGTEYRTERESFSKIVSYGSAGNGPAWFKIWTKAGQVIEYGNTTDSRIEAQGTTTVRGWAINKLSDTKGNYLTVNYTEDNANGDYMPSRIDYTGNANGLAPNNSLQFIYETRPDVVPAYLAGSIMKASKRLTGIRGYSATTLAREYRLTYGSPSDVGSSKLASIQTCDAAGICQPASQYSYSFDDDGTFPTNKYNTPDLSGYQAPYWQITMADINGDGKADLVGLYNNTVSDGVRAAVWLSNGDGTFSDVTYNRLVLSDYQRPSWQITLADINGDGKADVVALYNSSQTGGDGVRAVVWLSKGDGTFLSATWNTLAPSGAAQGYQSPYWRLSLADVNGDGRMDVIALYNAPDSGDGIRAAVWFSNGDGTFSTVTYNALVLSNYQSPDWQLSMADVNGDGKADVVALYNSSQSGGDGVRAVVWLSKGDGTFPSSTWNTLAPSADVHGYQSPYWRLTLADVNGDGRMDVVALYNAPNSGDGIRAAVWLSKGDDTFSAVSYNALALSNYQSPAWQLRLADVNGDGRADVVALYNSSISGGDGARAVVWLSKGDGTFPSATWNTLAPSGDVHGYQSPSWQLTLADVNGDGKADAVALYNNSITGGDGVRASVWLAKASSHSGMLSMTSGIGTSASFAYLPATSATIYTKDSGANYPLLDLQVPIYLVSQMTSSNGVGGTITQNYTYGGLKAEAGTGRGLLGFRWMQATQAETGITTRTEYRQDWPYVGLPSLVKKTVPLGGNTGVLSQTSYTYGCLNPQLSSACTIATGNRYFPYVSQSAESSWDLSGAALPTVTTTNAFDSYGNATQVAVTSSDGISKTTTNTYTNDPTNWHLGRLQRSQVQSVTP